MGKTPLAKPIAVSIGRRKISATKAGETTITRSVDVSAGETAEVGLATAATTPKDAPAPTPAPAIARAPVPASESASDRGTSPLLLAGWIGTGALVAGAVVTGILATGEASKLKDARNAFPGNKSDIDSKASTTTTLAVTTDILAAAAIILGGVSLYFTLSSPDKNKAAAARTPKVRLGGEPGRMMFGGTF
jgi:hypothetical protein